jgi:flagellar hook protein FlgE
MPSDSMNIGITGLDAYQAQIDVISNNIANVGTTAYKGQSLSFQDLLYQTQQPGSGPTKTSGGVNYQQIGIGVKVGGTDTNPTQGGVQTTGVTTNMMINGDGYFIMKNADGTGTPKYTRDGDFSLNSSGLLFDPSSGNAVMGYAADSAGNIVSGAPGPITVPIGLKSQATATGAGLKAGPTGDKVFDMSWGGNVDTGQYAAAVAAAATATAAPAVAATAAALAAAASTTATTAATTAVHNVANDETADTGATAAGTALTASNAASLAAATTGATAASVAAAANTAVGNMAAAAAGATPASVLAAVAGASATASADVSATLTTASANATAAAALTGATAGTVSSAANITAATNAAALPGATAASVLAAVVAATTAFAADSATSSAATATAVNALSSKQSLAASSIAIAAATSPASIAAAFAAGSTPATAGTTIYDSLGGAHLMNISFSPTNLGASMPMQVNDPSGGAHTAATAWTYTLTSKDGTLFSNGTTTSAPQYAFFDQGGQFINTSGSAPPLSTTVHIAGSAPSSTSGDQLAIKQWGTPAGSDNSTVSVVPPPAGPIGIDFSSMTSNSATAGVLATYQNGYAPGTLDNMTVGNDGTVTGTFTNGQSIAIAQVALATFQNEAGLLRTGSSNYEESVSSGEAQVGAAASGRFGTITGNSLELSNVSIGDEFTKLITAQNAFTANSKSITTANADDQTVIQLIR